MNKLPLYSSSGHPAGYLDEGGLWNIQGRKIGQFHGSEVYNHRGKYIGELRNGRLSLNLHKLDKKKSGFAPIKKPRLPFAPRVGPTSNGPNFHPFFHRP